MARSKQQLQKASPRKQREKAELRRQEAQQQQEAQWQQWKQWLKKVGLSDTPETFRELWAQFVKQQPHQEAELRRQEAQQRQEAQRKEGQQKQRQKKQRQKKQRQKEKWQAPPRRPRILSTEERQFNAPSEPPPANLNKPLARWACPSSLGHSSTATRQTANHNFTNCAKVAALKMIVTRF